MSKRYLFNVYLTGVGDNPDEAWLDATEATNLEEDPTPDKSDYQIIEEDE